MISKFLYLKDIHNVQYFNLNRIAQNKKLFADINSLENILENRDKEILRDGAQIEDLEKANARLTGEKHNLEANVYI